MNARTRRLRRQRRKWLRDWDAGWILMRVCSHGRKRLRWLSSWGPTLAGAGEVQFESFAIAHLTRWLP